ncbi:MAG: hypothetical protein HRU35_03395 [Rickettsiaceae bacterium]|nr:hypothetical protein [Rickettsiaceae bacterium]
MHDFCINNKEFVQEHFIKSDDNLESNSIEIYQALISDFQSTLTSYFINPIDNIGIPHLMIYYLDFMNMFYQEKQLLLRKQHIEDWEVMIKNSEKQGTYNAQNISEDDLEKIQNKYKKLEIELDEKNLSYDDSLKYINLKFNKIFKALRKMYLATSFLKDMDGFLTLFDDSSEIWWAKQDQTDIVESSKNDNNKKEEKTTHKKSATLERVEKCIEIIDNYFLHTYKASTENDESTIIIVGD